MAEEKPPAEEAGDDVEVLVDGTPLGMAPFVRKIVASVVVSLITSLKGAEKAREIRLVVRRKKGLEGYAKATVAAAGLGPLYVNAVHPRPAWPLLQIFQKLIELLLWPLGHYLHRAQVGEVAHVAPQAQEAGPRVDEIAEANPLHTAPYDRPQGEIGR